MMDCKPIGLEALLRYWELHFSGVDDRDLPLGLREEAERVFREWRAR